MGKLGLSYYTKQALSIVQFVSENIIIYTWFIKNIIEHI